MKKILKDGEIYFILGMLVFAIAVPSKNFYVNSILIPIIFLIQFIGLILIIKRYWNGKKK